MEDLLIRGGKILFRRKGITEKDALRIAENTRYSAAGSDTAAENDSINCITGAPESGGCSGTAEPGAERLEVLDASGLAVMPGFIDTHSHFRDPGFTWKEDLATGSAAAARGGYTSVILMANTNPTVDRPKIVTDILTRGGAMPVRIHTAANVTRGMQGKECVDFDACAEAGAICFTDDGKPVLDAETLRKALTAGARLQRPVSVHEEDPAYIKEPGVNAGGEAAAHLGLTGADRKAESTLAARDIAIAEETGGTLIIQHISAAETVDLVREARKAGVRVYAEATPHHFSLTERAVTIKGTLAKCNPPLRTERDRLAIVEGLADGTISVIATDHAPHAESEKAQPFTKAPSGMTGLETAFSLGLRNLVRSGAMPMLDFLKLLTVNPASIYGLDAGTLAEGAPADLVIADLDGTWAVRKEDFASKSSNSPFIGETLPGVIRYTIRGGEVVYRGAPDGRPA